MVTKSFLHIHGGVLVSPSVQEHRQHQTCFSSLLWNYTASKLHELLSGLLSSNISGIMLRMFIRPSRTDFRDLVVRDRGAGPLADLD